jgi:hypothetical protein
MTRPAVVDLDPLGAGLPRRVSSIHFSTPILPIWNFGIAAPDRGFLRLKVLFADRADIAQHMGEIGVARVLPRQADFGRHAGQGRGVDRDLREIFPAQPVLDGDRHEGEFFFTSSSVSLQLFGRSSGSCWPAGASPGRTSPASSRVMTTR